MPNYCHAKIKKIQCKTSRQMLYLACLSTNHKVLNQEFHLVYSVYTPCVTNALYSYGRKNSWRPVMVPAQFEK